MSEHFTSYFATPADVAMIDVAKKLDEHMATLISKGYVLHSVVPHTGVLQTGDSKGVPCTIGYTIIGLKPDTEPKLVIAAAA